MTSSATITHAIRFQSITSAAKLNKISFKMCQTSQGKQHVGILKEAEKEIEQKSSGE